MNWRAILGTIRGIQCPIYSKTYLATSKFQFLVTGFDVLCGMSMFSSKLKALPMMVEFDTCLYAGNSFYRFCMLDLFTYYRIVIL